MNVLVIGSGGREHALSWKISQSPKLNKLYIAPGNAGTESVGTNLPLDASNFEAVKSTLLERSIDLVLVGPEAPLVEGIHDAIAADADLQHILVVGPKKAGAQLEGSKDFAKAFMHRHGIPTAKSVTVRTENIDEGLGFLRQSHPPYVLKADGLAAGKGVLIEHDLDAAQSALEEMLSGKFGLASEKVVIEEFLDGIELSVFVLTDGTNYKLLPVAKDYKRIGDGDSGLNTGGMGSVSPVAFADEAFMDKVEERIVKPTISGLQKDNIPYVGFIFIGLMNVNGDPFVVEYNVRMGDPETEAVVPRIKSDFLELLEAAANANLNAVDLEIDERTAVSVMLVSGGYPEHYEKGKIITGFQKIRNALIFHAGTAVQEGKAVTNGGRVLAITALAKNLKEAISISYENAELLKFEKKNYRSDIGKDLLNH